MSHSKSKHWKVWLPLFEKVHTGASLKEQIYRKEKKNTGDRKDWIEFIKKNDFPKLTKQYIFKKLTTQFNKYLCTKKQNKNETFSMDQPFLSLPWNEHF